VEKSRRILRKMSSAIEIIFSYFSKDFHFQAAAKEKVFVQE
jgi:hypothetical protein